MRTTPEPKTRGGSSSFIVMTLLLIIGLGLTGCPAPDGGDGSVPAGSADPGVEVEPPDEGENGEENGDPDPEPDEDVTFGQRLKAAGDDPAAIAEVLKDVPELFFIAKKGAPAGGAVEAFKAHDAKRDVIYVPMFTAARRLDEFSRVVGAPRRPVKMVPAKALRTVLLVEAAEIVVNAKTEDETRLSRKLAEQIVARLEGGG